MDQKEIQKNDITDKINSIKSLYEKKNDNYINTGNTSVLKGGLKVSDKIEVVQCQLKECKQ